MRFNFKKIVSVASKKKSVLFQKQMFNNSFIFILNLSTQEFYNIRIFSKMNSLWVLLHFEERSVTLWAEV